MKHQITLIGGQIAPVYWGIKVKDPEVVHILYTKESRNHIPILKNIFNKKEFLTYQVLAYNFDEIKKVVEEIIFSNSDEEFELNLTGGTKVMALAGQNIFSSLGLNSFYIDQKHRVFDFLDYSYSTIESKIKLDTFMQLNGHRKYSFKKITDYSKDEIGLALEVNSISKEIIFNKAVKAVAKKISNIEICTKLSISHDSFQLFWDSPYFDFRFGENVITTKSDKALEISFKGLWWEIVIANAIKKWSKIYELVMNLELFSKTVDNNVKNEIDIVVNTGRDLVFIECKSGNVIQEDINKIRAVKKIYGGTSSHSVLVCKHQPRKDIIEKCNDLGIDIFYHDNLKDLIGKLENLLAKLEL